MSRCPTLARPGALRAAERRTVVLLDGGADLERPGGSIGTPLDNAIGYGCWHVARLLVERGAPVDAARAWRHRRPRKLTSWLAAEIAGFGVGYR